MGKAIVLLDSDFSVYNLGRVTRITKEIIPYVERISSATTFTVVEEGVQISNVSWSISDLSLASLVTNQDGSCTVTPLTNTSTPVQLTATFVGGTVTIAFLASLAEPVWVWYIDRCTTSPASGSINNGNAANGGWAFMDVDNALLQGKKINRIKVVGQTAGAMKVFKSASVSGATTLVGTFTIAANDIDKATIYEIPEFTLGSSEWLVFGEQDNASCFKYHLDTNKGLNGLYSKVPWSPSPASPVTPGQGTTDLNMSIGYYGYIDE